jgi:hypothetical protein
MGSEFVPDRNWPGKQPWRILGRRIVLLDPDTRRPLKPCDATTLQLDRMWGALHAWEHQHAGTLIGDQARKLRRELIETEDTARRCLRLAEPAPPEGAIAA